MYLGCSMKLLIRACRVVVFHREELLVRSSKWHCSWMSGPVLPDGCDVAASPKPAVPAEAPGNRKGVAASVADCCGSGFPSGQDVAASLVPAVAAAAY